MNRWLVTLAMCLAISSTFAAGQERSQQGKKKKNEVTIQGCVGRMSGDYLLFQTDPGNSYVLEANRKIKLENYMGQQVEVTGREHPTLSTSTNFTRRRAGSPVTILVDSINKVANQCSNE